MSGVPRDRPFARAAQEEIERGFQALVSENDRLRKRLEELEAESRAASVQFHQVEEHSGNLANLYVAAYQLHTTLDGDEILKRIVEIVINLLGSEEVAAFVPEGNGFRPVASFGVGDDAHAELAGSPDLARHSAADSPFVSEEPADGLTAVVPFRLDGVFVGSLVILRLLPHKERLAPVDHELIDLLGTHGAAALYCAELHRRAAA